MNITPAIIAHSQCLIRSLRHWTGRDLTPGITDPHDQARALFEAPFVLVSHGTEADPILNYGNATALQLWDISWDELTRMPSRLTAEAPNREERAHLLELVTRDGYIADYTGIRIGKTGRRFRIAQATVWNLIKPTDQNASAPAPSATSDSTYSLPATHSSLLHSQPCGQAAMFTNWTFLD